jgi:hypothetical protein
MSNTSILIILAISFERYHAICSPFEVLYACSKRRSLKIILGLWLAGLLSGLPMSFISFTETAAHVHWGDVEVCRTPIYGVWRTAYVVGMILIFFALPGVILVVLYVCLCSKMMRNSHSTSKRARSNDMVLSRNSTFTGATRLVSSTQRGSSRMRTYQFQVVLMLIIIIVMFFVCLIPMKVMILYNILTTEEQKESLGLEAYLNLICFARIMFYINSAVNPVLYNIVSTKFRHAFARAFSCESKSALTRRRRQPHNGPFTPRGQYTPYYRRSIGSKTWYSEFELYHNKSDASSSRLAGSRLFKKNSNEL